jgi:hypothetical protein
VIRTLHPELLDDLSANDPGAIGSRRDLRRLNILMGHATIIARALKKIFPTALPARIVEIGAGDGELLLRVASSLHRWMKSVGNPHLRSVTQRPPLPTGEGRGEGEGNSINLPVSNPQRISAPTDVLFIDLKNLLRDETKAEFAALNWRVNSIEANIFDWLKHPSANPDVILANLVLHHFTDAQLTLLFSELAEKTKAVIAVEPRRSRWPLICSRLLGIIGCNSVTRHDAPVSVRAGFTDRELSALWPHGNEWELTERRAGLLSHLFVARRKG